MNIWILNHYAVPQKYYHLARSYNFSKKLLQRGHKVTIFAASSVHNSDVNLITDGSKYREMEEDGLNYVLFKARQYDGSGLDRVINHIDAAMKMKRQCPKFIEKYGKPDVIYASAGQTLTLWAGIKLGRELGVPCVSEVTDLWPESFVSYGLISPKNPALKLLYKGERWVYENSDALIFSMEGGRDYIIEKGWDKAHGGPIDMEKVHYINNGVDLKDFNENKLNYTVSDTDLDDDESFKVVYCGSIRLVNDLSALLGAAEILKKQGKKNIKFLLYGDGNKREELQHEAENKDLDNVVFKGFVNGKYIPYILSKADICFMDGTEENSISKYGMSQNKLFSYMASGKAIISPVDSNYDLIKKYGCGMYIKNTPQAAADAIIELEKSPEKREKLGKAASELVSKFDFNVLTDELLDIFNLQVEKNNAQSR